MYECKRLFQLSTILGRFTAISAHPGPVTMAMQTALTQFSVITIYCDFSAPWLSDCEELGFPLVSPNTSQRISRLG